MVEAHLHPPHKLLRLYLQPGMVVAQILSLSLCLLPPADFVSIFIAGKKNKIADAVYPVIIKNVDGVLE